MIFELVFNIVKAALTFILGLFPSWSPVDFHAYAVEAVGWFPQPMKDVLRWADYYVPLHESIALALVGLTMWAGIVVYRVVRDILVILHIAGG